MTTSADTSEKPHLSGNTTKAELDPLSTTTVEVTSITSHEKSQPDIEESCATQPNDEKEEDDDRPTGIKFALLYTCILLGCFLVGYDNACLAVLAPVITDAFNALTNIGWYAIAYLLSMCGTLLIYGKLYSFYSMKKMFLGSLAILLIGNIVTASAPTSPVFILGRAISGLGAAGVFGGSNIIISQTTSLAKRPVYIATMGSVECTALALGPLIAGAIAHAVNWRLCFYICIPITAIIMATVFFCVGNIRMSEYRGLSSKERRQRMDLPGAAVILMTAPCFVLGLEWAGTTYAWANWRIILLFTLAGILFLVFIYTEYRAGENGIVPLKMLRRRTFALSGIVVFCNVGALSVIAYYIAIYFQAVRGATTLQSGLMYLPLAISMAITALLGGKLTSFVGYANPTLLLGAVLEIIGSALMTTLQPNTPAVKWIIYQIVYGIGIGMGFQPAYVAVQATLPSSEIPTALTTLAFLQTNGGIVILGVAGNVFFTRLSRNLEAAVPTLDAAAVLRGGALNVIRSVPDKYREQALEAYSATLSNVFYISLALSCVIGVCALGIEWKSIKEKKQLEEGQA